MFTNVPFIFLSMYGFFWSCILFEVVSGQTCEYDYLDVETDFLPQDCYSLINNQDPNNLTYYYYWNKDCFPVCKPYPAAVTGLCMTDPSVCTPGYICLVNPANNRPTCTEDPTTCAAYYAKGTKPLNAVWRPTCEKDGTFAAKQCKGDRATGRCFCYNGRGKRTFGQEWWSKAEDMNCGCSHRRSTLTDQAPEGQQTFVSLHCSSNGNYEKMQCDMESQQCWCVDEITGDLTAPVVPEQAIQKLPCYDPLVIGGQYLRQCESKLYAQTKILNQFTKHGTTGISFGKYLCDGDGAYGPFRVENGASYCTWRDNTLAGTWQGIALDHDDLDCNCARDSIYFAQSGKAQTQACEGWGDYKLYQVAGTIHYCVDRDGYKTSRDNTNDTITEGYCSTQVM